MNIFRHYKLIFLILFIVVLYVDFTENTIQRKLIETSSKVSRLYSKDKKLAQNIENILLVKSDSYKQICKKLK